MPRNAPRTIAWRRTAPALGAALTVAMALAPPVASGERAGAAGAGATQPAPGTTVAPVMRLSPPAMRDRGGDEGHRWLGTGGLAGRQTGLASAGIRQGLPGTSPHSESPGPDDGYALLSSGGPLAGGAPGVIGLGAASSGDALGLLAVARGPGARRLPGEPGAMVGADGGRDLAARGLRTMEDIGCTECHVRELVIGRAAAPGVPDSGHSPRAAGTRFEVVSDEGSGRVLDRRASRFLVRVIFSDLLRPEPAANFAEGDFLQAMRGALPGPGPWESTPAAIPAAPATELDLEALILRHGGAAGAARDAFARLPVRRRDAVIAFLQTLARPGPGVPAEFLDAALPRTGLFVADTERYGRAR